MQTIEASYDIVTPMFIGGGDISALPELRPPSIKGALRFWWRAMQWGNCLKENQGNSADALTQLHRQEADLFGIAAKSNTDNGQGAFFLKLKDISCTGVESQWPKNNDADAGFLGYGLDATKDKPNKKGQPHKKAIQQGGGFTVCLVLKKTITPQQIIQLKQVLTLWGLLGGLGSRSRRGFGSVALKKLDGKSFVFNDNKAYSDAVRAFFNPLALAPAMPIFTALNQSMIIAFAKREPVSGYKEVMNYLGTQYKEARTNAGKGMEKRAFGLPLAGLRGQSDEKNRRGSPLLMHIHKTDAGYVAVISFIPAQFHFQYPKDNSEDFYRPLQAYMATMERIYP